MTSKKGLIAWGSVVLATAFGIWIADLGPAFLRLLKGALGLVTEAVLVPVWVLVLLAALSVPLWAKVYSVVAVRPNPPPAFEPSPIQARFLHCLLEAEKEGVEQLRPEKVATMIGELPVRLKSPVEDLVYAGWIRSVGVDAYSLTRVGRDWIIQRVDEETRDQEAPRPE